MIRDHARDHWKVGYVEHRMTCKGFTRRVRPERVIGFLDVFGAFDPSLAFVLGGAVLVTTIMFRLVLQMRKPLLAPRFELPKTHSLDTSLIAGAAIFGVGWGLAGYRPGPALAGFAVGSSESIWFISAMLAGSAIYGWLDTRIGKTKSKRTLLGHA
jgi:uncharacterized protein